VETQPSETKPRTGTAALVRDLGTAANIASIGRVVCIYLTLYLLSIEQYRWGLALGVFAGLTDYLDGYLARRLNQRTRIGALLDQAADVLFIVSSIFLFANRDEWPALLFYIVLFREVVVLNLRVSAAQMGFEIPSIFLGKWASNWMFYALALKGAVHAVGVEPWSTYIRYLSDFGMLVGATSSVITAFIYARSFARQYVAL
jgi:cardiolipin synthase